MGCRTRDVVMAWLSEVQKARTAAAARVSDSWLLPLGRLHGAIGDDGIERVTTQTVLDVLGVDQCRRRAGTYRRLAKLMAELGWSAVRVRGVTRGGYLEQCRGFARLGPSGHPPDRTRSRAPGAAEGTASRS
jgi:hypothetical protein